MAYYRMSGSTMTKIGDQARRLSGLNESMTPSRMIDELSKLRGVHTFPDNVVYYNNMNGEEYATITPRKFTYSNSTYTELDDFVITDKWGDAYAASMASGSESRELCFQKSRTSDEGLDQYTDNGYSSGSTFTIGGWFRKTEDTNTYERAIFCYDSVAWGLYLPANTNTSISMDFGGGAYANVYSIVKDVWYHFAITFIQNDNGTATAKVYVNGSLIKTYNATHTMAFSQVTISHCGGYPWRGSVKNVFISKGALSDDDIRRMMLTD